MNNTLSRAIAHYGVENQTIQAIQEMSELTKELTKSLLGRQDVTHIIEEIADVEIMVEQLKMMYDGSEGKRVAIVKKAKLDRLESRIKGVKE